MGLLGIFPKIDKAIISNIYQYGMVLARVQCLSKLRQSVNFYVTLNMPPLGNSRKDQRYNDTSGSDE